MVATRSSVRSSLKRSSDDLDTKPKSTSFGDGKVKKGNTKQRIKSEPNAGSSTSNANALNNSITASLLNHVLPPYNNRQTVSSAVSAVLQRTCPPQSKLLHDTTVAANLALFLFFVDARQKMHRKKEEHNRQRVSFLSEARRLRENKLFFSKKEYFTENIWCNNRRELDRGTRYFRD